MLLESGNAGEGGETMKVALVTVVLLLALGTTASAEPISQTYAASIDRVWSTTIAVLEALGWDIDKADRTIGWITTESRRVEGEDYGVYAKGLRHRLVLHVREAGNNRATVSVERSVFKRERILWMDNDEAVTTTDRSVEKSLLEAIQKSL
jgi:hypothetical protein